MQLLVAACCVCGGLAVSVFADENDGPKKVEGQNDAQLPPQTPLKELMKSIHGLDGVPYEAQYVVGVQLQTIPDGLRPRLKLEPGTGLLVASVLDGKPAALAGVRENDLLLKVNGTAVDEPMDVVRLINESKAKPVTLTLLRDAEAFDVEVVPVKSSELSSPGLLPAASGISPPEAYPPAVRIVGPGVLMNGTPMLMDPSNEIEQLKEQVRALQTETAALKQQLEELSKKLDEKR